MSAKYEHTIPAVDDEVAITKSLKRLFHKTEYTIHTANKLMGDAIPSSHF